MDASPAALIQAVAQMQRSQVTQTAQLLVLKNALDIQASGASALIQALPANLPLASSGMVGTQVNVMA